MSKLANTIYVYSFYPLLMGLGLMIAPNMLLSVFGFLETTEIWVRMLGLLTFVVGVYYFQSAKKEQTAFFEATILGRTIFFVVTAVFVAIFRQSYMLGLIGSVDLIGAIWTYWVLSQTKK